MDIPFWSRLSTRLSLLILAIVLVLATATGILVNRGFSLLDSRAQTQVEAEQASPAQADTPSPQANPELSDIVRSTVINLIAVFLLTLVGATVFSRSLLTEPITSLVRATQEVAEGHLGVTLDVSSRGELGLLASTFNQMSLSLEARTEDLLAANEALRESEARLEQRVLERTAELASLLELSNATALTTEDMPLLERIFDRLYELVPYESAALFRRTQGDEVALVLSRGEALNVQTTDMLSRKTPQSSAEGEHTQRTLPLIVRDRAVGILALEHTGNISDDKLRLVSAFANQAGVTLENIRLYEQVQERAAFEERQHLARELHDSVSQALYSIVLGTHAARQQLEQPEKAGQALEYVQHLSEAALAEMRALIFELRPDILEREGLAAALRKQAEALEVRHDLHTEYFESGEPDVSFPVKQALYRISQEITHNITKHANAEHVVIHLEQSAEQVRLEVSDDGVGFDVQDFPGHLGLKSMRERSTSLGGTFEVESAPGQGTRVSVAIPKQASITGDNT